MRTNQTTFSKRFAARITPLLPIGVSLGIVLCMNAPANAQLPPAIWAPDYLEHLLDNHVSPHCSTRDRCVEFIGGADINVFDNTPVYLADALYLRNFDGWKQMNAKQYAWDVYCIEENMCYDELGADLSAWFQEQINNLVFEELPVEYGFAQYWVNAEHKIVTKEDWENEGIDPELIEKSWLNTEEWNKVDKRVYTVTSRARTIDKEIIVELQRPIVLYPPGRLFDEHNGHGWTQHFTESTALADPVEYAQWLFHIDSEIHNEYWPRVELTPQRDSYTGLPHLPHVRFRPAADFEGDCGVILRGVPGGSASFSGFAVEGFKTGICAGYGQQVVIHGVSAFNNDVGIEGSSLVISGSYVIENKTGLRISNSLVVETALEYNEVAISDYLGGGHVYTPTGGFRWDDQTIIYYEVPYDWVGTDENGDIWEPYPQLDPPEWMVVAQDVKEVDGEKIPGWVVWGKVNYDFKTYGEKPVTVMFYKSDMGDNPTELVHAALLEENKWGWFVLETFLDQKTLKPGDPVVVQVYPGDWTQLVEEMVEQKADNWKIDAQLRSNYYDRTMAAFVKYFQKAPYVEKIAPSVPANPVYLPKDDEPVVWKPSPHTKSMKEYPRQRGGSQ